MDIDNIDIKELIKIYKQSQVDTIAWAESTERGQPLKVIANTQQVLDHHAITVRYNEMSKKQEIDIPGERKGNTWENDAITLIHSMCQSKHYSITVDLLAKHIDLIAAKNSYHPVKDWLDGLTWDGETRIKQVSDSIILSEPNPMKETFIRKWMISLVAAIYHPNFSCEGVLTLFGRQGIGKTRWIQSLLPDEAINRWNKDAVVLDFGNKDSLFKALSYWISELGELDATFNKQQIEALKGFITEKQDVLRSPYNRKADTHPRRTVFYATVNEKQFLRDAENRRFWVLDVERFEAQPLDIEQIWAEAKYLYMNNQRTDKTGIDPWFLTAEERAQMAEIQEEYRSVSSVEEILENKILPADDARDHLQEPRNVTEIMQCCGFGMSISNQQKAQANRWLQTKGYLTAQGRKFRVTFTENTQEEYERKQDINAKIIELKGKMSK